MSRSGYDTGIEQWELIRYRGQVASAIRGKRGQAFLRDLVQSLDTLPERKLIRQELACSDGVCAIGSVGRMRGTDMGGLDPDDIERVARVFDIATPLAREVVFENDDAFYKETPENRWIRMRRWAVANLKPSDTDGHPQGGNAKQVPSDSLTAGPEGDRP